MNFPGATRNKFLIAVVLLVGLVARFGCGPLGHNYDFESYRVVADLTAQGKNVYANTDRYNYGPVWFNVLHLLDVLAGRNPEVFRWLLIGILSAADVGIFLVLLREFGVLAAALFFLNPVSVLITGFHNQFDNLALLLGWCAVLLFGRDFEQPLARRQFLALTLLGLSLMTKHLLFAFPIWLALKQKGLWQKCLVVLIPLTIFALGFVPYWSEGRQGILDNVIRYRSMHTCFFFDFFVPEAGKQFLGPQSAWILMLGLFAFICRKKSAAESFLIYTAVLVAASPATTNQYLAIPAAFTSVFVNPITVLYTLAATYHIMVDYHGLHLIKNPAYHGNVAIYILCMALVWIIWRKNILSFVQKCRDEIRIQSEP